MANLTNIRPAQVFPPGYFIKDQLEQRQWNQNELAEVLGITPRHLSQVMNGEVPLNYDLAIQLGQVFDTSPQLWSNLYLSYALWSEPAEEELSQIAIKASIYERMPIRDMVKKGWMKKPKSVQDLEQQVADFWGRDDADLSFIDTEYSPCLNRSTASKADQYNTSYALTWYRKASMCASKRDVPGYNKRKLEILFNSMYAHTVKPADIKAFLAKLNDCGVKFLVLPHLEKTYLDGAAFKQGSNPVVVYTARYKRIDSFWFTLAHEIAHVLLHLDKQRSIILDDLHEGEASEMENEANALAGEKLRHPEIAARFRDSGQVHPKRIEACAQVYGVHPSIVAGKLAHDGLAGYRVVQRYSEDVLAHIPKAYLN
jgi:HTH-type transcriptional regulator/antitoxin HigA